MARVGLLCARLLADASFFVSLAGYVCRELLCDGRIALRRMFAERA